MSTQVKPSSVARYGFWTVSALVLLRLATGWHFYSEGLEKLEPGFSSAGLIGAAQGPLAPLYKSFLPSPAGYDELLATPRQAVSLSPEQQQENAAWAGEYAGRKKAAEKAKERYEAEFPPHSAYSDWAKAVKQAWQEKRDAAARARGTEEAKAAAEEAYRTGLIQLEDYLLYEADSIEEYRHELWRLEQMKQKPGADEIAFREERIADKTSETWLTGRSWKADVLAREEGYVEELAAVTGAKEALLRTPSNLDWINPMVACVVLGVGGCLLLGLCTRLAAVVGAGFLLSVMASQPPWLPESDTTYFGYQLVEVGVMLTLAAVGAGRWYGIDSVLQYCCSTVCGPKN